MRFKDSPEENFGEDVISIQTQHFELKLTVVQEDMIARHQDLMQLGHVERNENHSFR